MQEQLITFETAKLAKEKGFNRQCFYYYDKTEKLIEPYEENGSSTDVEFRVNLTDLLDNYNEGYRENYSAPTQSLLQKWLREVHKIHIVIQDGFNTEILQMSYYPVLYPFIKNKDKDEGYEYLGDVWKNSYEEALEIGLQEGLKLIP